MSSIAASIARAPLLLAALPLISALALAGGGEAAAKTARLKFGTTTSADNTGLLKALLPPFEKTEKVKVDVIAVGTGKALALARNGDLDLVLVHDPAAEKAFLESGYGLAAVRIMRNHFVILGPEADPAGVRKSPTAIEAFRKIFNTRPPFVSRGDASGTHAREMLLWHAAGLTPPGGSYMETGQGMGATLAVADEKEAYTLCDAATCASYRREIGLKVLYGKKESILANTYNAIAVNPEKHPHVDHERAAALIEWMTSKRGQRIIRDFKTGGKRLFEPAARK